jgi:hypothetical protein
MSLDKLIFIAGDLAIGVVVTWLTVLFLEKVYFKKELANQVSQTK